MARSRSVALLVALALAFSLVVATHVPAARGDVVMRLPRLVQLRAEVASARGPRAYLALRSIWAEWDRGDPGAVEELLHDVAVDPSEPPPLREYAGLLEAYARRRRGDIDGARVRIARLGYIADWMIVGPFDNDGKTGFTTAYDPETEQDAPLNLTRDYDGKDHRPVRWRRLPAVSPFGWVDFGALLRPAEQSCVYATTFARDARLRDDARKPVSIWTGATGALELSWNGARIFRDEKYRDIDSDRFATEAILREGWNRLTVKVCGDERAPMLSLRVAGADGGPDAHLEVDPDPQHATRAGGAFAARRRGTTDASAEAAPLRTGGQLEGPAQSFQRLATGGGADDLEAYARYLSTTGSDDPTEHRAREIARKAAEVSPTIPRLLLAGDLAENRNQRASWVERAEAIVAAGHATREQTIDALLARASYAREGVNWRDAMPFYEKVLGLDADNLPATLAKVELYEEAGLRGTALAEVETALARMPRSVALLRAALAALRDQARDTEADELAERYSALRFDDPSFARARIDLAVARRNEASAARWIDRLVATNPDSVSGLQFAARAWKRLGDGVRAIAFYRAALDLAPEDTDVMRELATAYALAGQRDEQLRLLKSVLSLMPQANDVRQQLANIEPASPRPDEQYARPASEFLARRALPADGQARRNLVSLQVTTVFPNGLASRYHQVVYQPLTEAAAAESREYDFEYETDSQTVQVRSARVYRKDGVIDEAVESGAGAMANDPAFATYSSARSYYVRFPRLQPGDVVELQFRVEDVAQRNEFADYFGEVVYVQSTERIDRSEYVLITPKSRTFYFNDERMQGLARGIEDRADQRIYHFIALDVPPVQAEPRQPPWSEILGHVHVSTYKSWEDMGRWYWRLVRDQFVPDDEVRQRAEALTKGLRDDGAKVRAIYDYVVQKTRYVALEFGIHGYKPYRCAQIFARGFGDCKDKATLIVTMLNALGIKATPVVVRSANKGYFEKSPASLAAFDHMIAYVPALDVYLDGTAEYTGSLELPAMDRDAMALQVNEGKAAIVQLPDPPPESSVSAHRMEANLGTDGTAQIDWQAQICGVDAPEWRVRFHAAATRKQRVQQWMGGVMPGAEVMTVDAGDIENVEQKITLRIRANAAQFARAEGDAFTLPLGRREHMVRDYAPLVVRKLDVRLHARSTEEEDWTVHLPPRATVRSLPSSAKGASPFGSYEVTVQSSGSTLHARTTVRMAKTRISPIEYSAFRSWCETVDRALGQQATVVLR
ncbi:MAG: DUF3857 domain-containing protein [Myxococcota bacterium]|nr:DUF3857 domain-containing protein [Myxococcota bacterium]